MALYRLTRGLTHAGHHGIDGRPRAILQLLPFSLSETPKVNLLYGGFPEVLARPKARALWFSSYLQTYLERDVRAITNVRDLVTFRRFLSLLASRSFRPRSQQITLSLRRLLAELSHQVEKPARFACRWHFVEIHDLLK